MGQYFQLINVDRREALFMGKLGEGLYQYRRLPLLKLLLRQVEPQSDSVVGIWAGHRIITAGDDMGECPSGMLTEAEQTESGRYGNFYSFASQTFQDFPARFFFQSTQILETRNDLVLRNLSLHIYVRVNDFERILVEKLGSEGLQFREGKFTLTILILVNTSWSDDPSCSCCPSFEIVPGPWAGDRFDVTSIEELKSDESDLWQDVTEEQVERAFTIVEGDS